jgi:hypothetical protein
LTQTESDTIRRVELTLTQSTADAALDSCEVGMAAGRGEAGVPQEGGNRVAPRAELEEEPTIGRE